MHESTGRGLCQLAFVFLGALPVLGCVGLCALQFFPAYHRWQARQFAEHLSQALGLAVEIGGLETAAPSLFRLHDIRLRNPESHALLGQIESAEVVRQKNQWLVSIASIELKASELEESGRLVHDRFMCRRQVSGRATVLAVDELVIQAADREPRRLHRVSAKVIPGPAETWFSADWNLGPMELDERQEPGGVVVRRFHEHASRMTRAQLHTGSQSLPLALVQPFWPEVTGLGESAHFSGAVDLKAYQTGWQINIETDSVIQNVDFGSLFWNATEIAGVGQIGIQRAQISQAGIEMITGNLRIGPGRISRRALLASQQHLGFHLDRSVNQAATHEVSFDEGYCFFHIAPASLHLVGVLSDARGQLAVRNEQNWAESIPLSRFVTSLEALGGSASNWPSSEPGIPHGRLARLAMQWLPLGDPVTRTASRGQRLSLAE